MSFLRAREKPTTIGDLIVELTDEIGSFVHDEQEVYRVVASLLSDIFVGSSLFSRKWH